jgi:hypothetical protein
MHNLLYYWLFSLCSFWDCLPDSQISTFTNQDVNVFPKGLLLKTLVSCKAQLQISPTLGNTTQPNPHTGHHLYLTTHLGMFQHCIDQLMEYTQSCPPKKCEGEVMRLSRMKHQSGTHVSFYHVSRSSRKTQSWCWLTFKRHANCCNIIIYLWDGRIRQVIKLISNASSGYCCTCSETW